MNQQATDYDFRGDLDNPTLKRLASQPAISMAIEGLAFWDFSDAEVVREMDVFELENGEASLSKIGRFDWYGLALVIDVRMDRLADGRVSECTVYIRCPGGQRMELSSGDGWQPPAIIVPHELDSTLVAFCLDLEMLGEASVGARILKRLSNARGNDTLVHIVQTLDLAAQDKLNLDSRAIAMCGRTVEGKVLPPKAIGNRSPGRRSGDDNPVGLSDWRIWFEEAVELEGAGNVCVVLCTVAAADQKQLIDSIGKEPLAFVLDLLSRVAYNPSDTKVNNNTRSRLGTKNTTTGPVSPAFATEVESARPTRGRPPKRKGELTKVYGVSLPMRLVEEIDREMGASSNRSEWIAEACRMRLAHARKHKID